MKKSSTLQQCVCVGMVLSIFVAIGMGVGFFRGANELAPFLIAVGSAIGMTVLTVLIHRKPPLTFHDFINEVENTNEPLGRLMTSLCVGEICGADRESLSHIPLTDCLVRDFTQRVIDKIRRHMQTVDDDAKTKRLSQFRVFLQEICTVALKYGIDVSSITNAPITYEEVIEHVFRD